MQRGVLGKKRPKRLSKDQKHRAKLGNQVNHKNQVQSEVLIKSPSSR
jgi:hypothetical protein